MSDELTKLKAVNMCLSAIDETPVNSLGSGQADAESAETIVDQTTIEVLARGWHENTQHKVKLTPDGNSNIVVPANTLTIDSDYSDEGRDVVKVGTKLFDRDNNTFTFTSSIYVTLAVTRDWEELSYPLRRYIAARASRVFQEDDFGSATLDSFASREEAEALAVLEMLEAEKDDLNIFTGTGLAYRIGHRNNPGGGFY